MNNDIRKAIEAKKAQRKQTQREMAQGLVQNEEFISIQAQILATADEVQKLDTIIHQLNTGITPFVAKDGSKYTVRVFPITQFGLGLDRLMGIISGSASAFTEEMALQYEAIVGVPFIELQMANQVLGTVDYVNKDGIYVEGSRSIEMAELPGDTPIEHLKAVKQWRHENARKLHHMLRNISISLDIYEIVPSVEKLEEALLKWEMSAKNRAKKKLEEQQKANELDDSKFTIED